jgi:hypothetical protein
LLGIQAARKIISCVEAAAAATRRQIMKGEQKQGSRRLFMHLCSLLETQGGVVKPTTAFLLPPSSYNVQRAAVAGAMDGQQASVGRQQLQE